MPLIALLGARGLNLIVSLYLQICLVVDYERSDHHTSNLCVKLLLVILYLQEEVFLKEVYTKFVHLLLTEKYHLTYKFMKTECKLVRSILSVHCFREVNIFYSY